MWIWLEIKSWIRAKAIAKSTAELKAEFVCIMNVGEKKNNSFEIHVIILRHIKNINLPIKKNFKFAQLLTKTPFSFRDRPENAKGKKQRRRQKYVRKSY